MKYDVVDDAEGGVGEMEETGVGEERGGNLKGEGAPALSYGAKTRAFAPSQPISFRTQLFSLLPF